jgi:hypothetical protein
MHNIPDDVRAAVFRTHVIFDIPRTVDSEHICKVIVNQPFHRTFEKHAEMYKSMC